ncbi:hypothetical protein J6590_000387 [Homalodisca vitripennis]|nr:hypothetical protein J6590_000387 [Homalodisca vitripennis]
MRIEVLENKFKQERKIRNELIHQSDTEKTELKAKLNYFEKQNRNLENFNLANKQTEYLEEKLKQCITVNLELNTTISNLKSEIQILKYPCKTCINYKEEIKHMTERLKVFEQENQSLLIINEENQVLQTENEAPKNEVTNLQTVIKVLQADNRNEDPTPPSKESSFTVPRKTFKAALPNNSRLIELKNSFNILNKIDNGNLETLNVFNMRDFPPLSTKNTTSTGIESLNNINTNKKKKTQRTSAHNTELQSKVLILSGSHGKNLFRGVQSRSFDNVTVITRPGAPLQHVTSDIDQLTHGFTADDYVVVIRGTNDVGKNNLIASSINLKKHDKPHLDEQISHINDNLMKWSTGAEAVSILPLHRLPRHFYTKHGLHLNKLGKEKICQMIVGATREMRQHRMVLEQCVTSLSVAAELKNPSADIVLHQLPQTPITSRAVFHELIEDQVSQANRNPIITKSSKIKIIQEDMSKVIKEFRNDPNTAFSHCISADIGSDRHMTAGVAVAFGRNFGKPSTAHLLNSHLTYQQEKGKAGIYGLVTKTKHFEKPTSADYDTAFHQFAADFINRGHKQLICSPMGCVRDNIQLEQFLSNLIEFQKSSGVDVTIIVSYEERLTRRLYNGLEHPDFMKRMETIIQHLQEHSMMTAQKEEPSTSSRRANHCVNSFDDCINSCPTNPFHEHDLSGVRSATPRNQPFDSPNKTLETTSPTETPLDRSADPPLDMSEEVASESGKIHEQSSVIDLCSSPLGLN